MYTYLRLTPMLQLLETDDPALLLGNGRIYLGKDLTVEEVLKILRDGIIMATPGDLDAVRSLSAIESQFTSSAKV